MSTYKEFYRRSIDHDLEVQVRRPAAIDRVVHHSVILDLAGVDSYRVTGLRQLASAGSALSLGGAFLSSFRAHLLKFDPNLP